MELTHQNGGTSACYETFGWTPEDNKKLDEDKAWRIAIRLTEIAKYIYNVQKDAEDARKRSPGNKVDFFMDDDAWDIDLAESEDETVLNPGVRIKGASFVPPSETRFHPFQSFTLPDCLELRRGMTAINQINSKFPGKRHYLNRNWT